MHLFAGYGRPSFTNTKGGRSRDGSIFDTERLADHGNIVLVGQVFPKTQVGELSMIFRVLANIGKAVGKAGSADTAAMAVASRSRLTVRRIAVTI